MSGRTFVLAVGCIGIVAAAPWAGIRAAAEPGTTAEAEAVVGQQDPAPVQQLGQRLRCPVCQGMSIGDSPSPMAQDMMRQVRRMYQEGQTVANIEAFFTSRYGTWVLLDPPKQGVSLWVWLLPPAFLLLGTGAALLSLRRRRRAAPCGDRAPAAAASAATVRSDNLAALWQEAQQ